MAARHARALRPAPGRARLRAHRDRAARAGRRARGDGARPPRVARGRRAARRAVRHRLAAAVGASAPGPCTAILAGDHFLLIDAGPGANDRMGLLRLPREAIDGVLAHALPLGPHRRARRDRACSRGRSDARCRCASTVRRASSRWSRASSRPTRSTRATASRTTARTLMPPRRAAAAGARDRGPRRRRRAGVRGRPAARPGLRGRPRAGVARLRLPHRLRGSLGRGERRHAPERDTRLARARRRPAGARGAGRAHRRRRASARPRAAGLTRRATHRARHPRLSHHAGAGRRDREARRRADAGADAPGAAARQRAGCAGSSCEASRTPGTASIVLGEDGMHFTLPPGSHEIRLEELE